MPYSRAVVCEPIAHAAFYLRDPDCTDLFGRRSEANPSDTRNSFRREAVPGAGTAAGVGGIVTGSQPLMGRVSEQATLQSFLQPLVAGMSVAVVMRGEPGMGKSALLDSLVSSAAGMQCATVTGLEAESGLVYAGLHRLLIPHISRIGRLPSAQRIALNTALGLREGPPSSPFLVGHAVLTALSDIAEAAPLLCVVDDAQWLDHESLAVLAFVARRLYAEQVALVFAVREPPRNSALDGIPDLMIRGLAPESGADLLELLAHGRVDRQSALQLSELAGGNPLVLTEIGREMASGRAAPGLLLNEPVPLGLRLETHFRQRLRDLPDTCRTLLLLAAADSGDDRGLLWRAAALAGLTPADAVPAEAAHLIRLAAELTFCHPLIRSAVYGLAEPAARRSAHELLARACDANTDPDIRAWHLARSAIGPDEAIAAELEGSAARAKSRGGLLAEADFLAQSGALSPEIIHAARRTLAAAHAAIAGGAPLRAAAILDRGDHYLRDRFSLAQGSILRQRIRYLSGLPLDELPRTLLAAAETFSINNPRLTRQALLDAVELAFVTGDLISGTTGPDVGRAALSLHLNPEQDAGTADLLLTALATLAGIGYVDAAPHLRRAVAALQDPESFTQGVPDWFVDGLYAAHALWDDRGRHEWLERGEKAARTSGALHSLQLALTCLSTIEAQTGQLNSAQARSEESRQLAASIGWSPAKVAVLANPELLAWQGRDAAATVATENLKAASIRLRASDVNRPGYRAMMIVHLGHAHYQDGFAVASRMHAQDTVHFDNDALPNLVESGVRSGHLAQAAAALAELTARATASGTPWATGLLARCRALLADEPEVDYQQSIADLEKTSVITDLARSHLVYGEWLRRRKRKRDAGLQLRLAFDILTDIGAVAFTDRVTVELRAIGDRVVTNRAEPGEELTAQEAQVAQLAADGATNQMIAAELFISAHTVGYHLTKAFRKLGVTSRAQLHLVLHP